MTPERRSKPRRTDDILLKDLPCAQHEESIDGADKRIANLEDLPFNLGNVIRTIKGTWHILAFLIYLSYRSTVVYNDNVNFHKTQIEVDKAVLANEWNEHVALLALIEHEHQVYPDFKYEMPPFVQPDLPDNDSKNSSDPKPRDGSTFYQGIPGVSFNQGQQDAFDK